MFFGFGIFFDHFSDVLIFSALHVGQFTEGLPRRFCSNSLPHFLQVARRGSGLFPVVPFLTIANILAKNVRLHRIHFLASAISSTLSCIYQFSLSATVVHILVPGLYDPRPPSYPHHVYLQILGDE